MKKLFLLPRIFSNLTITRWTGRHWQKCQFQWFEDTFHIFFFFFPLLLHLFQPSPTSDCSLSRHLTDEPVCVLSQNEVPQYSVSQNKAIVSWAVGSEIGRHEEISGVLGIGRWVYTTKHKVNTVWCYWGSFNYYWELLKLSGGKSSLFLLHKSLIPNVDHLFLWVHLLWLCFYIVWIYVPLICHP